MGLISINIQIENHIQRIRRTFGEIWKAQGIPMPELTDEQILEGSLLFLRQRTIMGMDSPLEGMALIGSFQIAVGMVDTEQTTRLCSALEINEEKVIEQAQGL